MSETKFTPGEFELGELDGGYMTIWCDDKIIADVKSEDVGDDECVANACLLKEAKNLYAACEAWQAFHERYKIWGNINDVASRLYSDAVNKTESVLKKARGES